MSLLLIAAGLGAIAWLDVPRLIEQKEWKELAVWIGLWLIAAVWAVLIALDVPMPIISSYITLLSRSIVNLFTGGGAG